MRRIVAAVMAGVVVLGGGAVRQMQGQEATQGLQQNGQGT